MRRGWTARVICLSASGLLRAFTTKVLTLLWGAPFTATREWRPTIWTDGQLTANRSSDCKMNLLIDGSHAMIDGEPKRWVLYSPTPRPYLFDQKNNTLYIQSIWVGFSYSSILPFAILPRFIILPPQNSVMLFYIHLKVKHSNGD